MKSAHHASYGRPSSREYFWTFVPDSRTPIWVRASATMPEASPVPPMAAVPGEAAPVGVPIG